MINAPAKGTPLIVTNNPLRKQTLLGIAPVIPPHSEPQVAGAEPQVAESESSVAGAEPQVAAATGAPLVVPAAENPLRKQTLLGIAPVTTAQPKLEVAPATEPSSVSSIVTPAALETDAPTATDMPEPLVAAESLSSERPKPGRAALSISHDDLPELKPRRPRWALPLGVAAALALGVVGLRQLDHAPTPTPAELAHPLNAAKPGAKALQAAPRSDDSDDDDDSNDPNAGNDPTPAPTPPEPEPLKAKPADDAKPGAAAEKASEPTAIAAPGAAAATAPAGTIRINVESDPPHARMFWKGKEVGTTPFVLELQPGEKHAYELGLPGYTTRKVVIDGSKTDISIGLRPEPTPLIGGRRGK